MADRKDRKMEVPRREFLITAVAGTAVALGHSFLDLRLLAAQVKSSGKPVFSDAAFNSALPASPGPAYQTLLTEIERDPKGFVRSHFTLTPAQEKDLATLSPEEMATFQRAISAALQKSANLRMKCAEIAPTLTRDDQLIAQSKRFTVLAKNDGAAPAPKLGVKDPAAAAKFTGIVNITMIAAKP